MATFVVTTSTINDNGDNDAWTEEFLIDELFLQLVGTKMIVKHNDGKCITVHKYYNQAYRLRKWIPIATKKPIPAETEFVINLSDLTTRIISELKALDKEGSQYVLKQAVGRIFENIDSRQHHLSIARKLKVRLDA
jgi:hypothetical protein